MFRVIFAALARGLRRAWDLAATFVFWPFWLFSRTARPGTIGHKIESVKAVEKQVAARAPAVPDISESIKRDSAIAWSCIAVAMMTRQPLVYPATLSKTMKSFLQGLDYNQLKALQDAGAKGIYAHFTGKTLISGVPMVKTLPPVEIKFPPAAARKLATELSSLEVRDRHSVLVPVALARG